MARSRRFVFLVLLLLLIILASPVRAQANIQVLSNEASLAFPQSISFKAEFQAGADITSVVLEYGVDQLTFGTVEAKAFPQFSPAPDLKVEWTWEMLQSGSLPPGATIWWRWLVGDSGGTQLASPKQTVLWLDDIHSWEGISGGNINLHYYDGGVSFGQELHDAAVQALNRLSQDVGLESESPIDIYIYASFSDLREAILYEPSWVGGQAFPQNNIVIIGVSPDQLDWGKSTEAHELTHVLVGHLTFSRLGSVPTWLDEGLAMYGEGGIQNAEQAQFDQAKTANQLSSLRSLTGSFSEESSRATLSYTISFSVVDFMIKTYGQSKMQTLLLDLRDGQTADQALQAVYGFDTDGLEDAWRAAIGAPPRAGALNSTPLPTPTQVPTFVPVGAAPVAQAAVLTPHPTSIEATVTATPPPVTQATGSVATRVPLAQRLGIGTKDVLTVLEVGAACLVAMLLLVGLPVIFSLRRHSRKK